MPNIIYENDLITIEVNDLHEAIVTNKSSGVRVKLNGSHFDGSFTLEVLPATI